MEVEMRGAIKAIAMAAILCFAIDGWAEGQTTDPNNPYGAFDSLDEVTATDPFGGGLGATPLTPLEVLTDIPGDTDDNEPDVDIPHTDEPGDQMDDNDGTEDPIIILPEPPNPGLNDNIPGGCAASDCLGIDTPNLDTGGSSSDADVPLPASVLLLLSGLVGGVIVRKRQNEES